MDKRITVKIVVKLKDTSVLSYHGITSFIEDRFPMNDIIKANIIILENYNEKAKYLIMGYGITKVTKECICNTAIEFLENYLRNEEV